MTYSIDQVKKGVAAYLDTEFIPLIDDGFKRVLIGAGISIAINKYANILPLLAENNKFVKSLELMDQDGNVNLDMIYDAVQSQIKPDGFSVEVPVIGTMRLKQGDIETLYKTIKAQK